MMRDIGPTRRFTSTDPDSTAPARAAPRDDSPARRAAALVGENSPLRPGPFGGVSRPSAEFGVALGRLSDAFQQIRGSLQQLDAKMDDLRDSLDRTTDNVDAIHVRLNLENARLDVVDGRLTELEGRQAAALDTVQRRVVALSRQLAFGLGMTLMLAALAVGALLFVR